MLGVITRPAETGNPRQQADSTAGAHRMQLQRHADPPAQHFKQDDDPFIVAHALKEPDLAQEWTGGHFDWLAIGKGRQ